MVVEAAKKFYTMQLQMDLVSMETIEVAEENGTREHVTFCIIAKQIKDPMTIEGPPTFIAQTKKHSERQILKEDVEAVKAKLEQIRTKLGEGALPLMRKKSVISRWRMAAKITLLHRGFVPNYPETLAINPRMFIEIFPYHLIVDKDLKIEQSGIKIQTLMPSIRSRQALLTDYFLIRYPNCVDLTYTNIERFICCPFVLEFRKENMKREWVDRPSLQLKGQMFLLRDSGFFVYIASPIAHCWSDLEHRKLKLSDIPVWDVTRDFLVADLEYRKYIENNVRASLTGSEIPTRRASAWSRRGSLGEDSALRDRIFRLQRELDNERRRSDALYRAFLPKDAIDLVYRDMVSNGEFYQQATALFCDVVQFLPMVARCAPSDVISLLNTLQTTFDNITKIHNLIKVESVGDAYLAVAGVGVSEKREQHAERVANTALGMRITARDLTSPLDGESIQLRFGIHTGSLVTGVLGQKVPRFVAMGETCVLASKLESHGEPGKIHISPTTYQILVNKGFSFEKRGKIELRGYGMLETYFLLKNDILSEDDLLGRSHNNPEVMYINEGRVAGLAYARNNRVYPIAESTSSVSSRPLSGESGSGSLQTK
ncbi:hypothetical protein DPMN_139739 [Dreissena polymorpha]|nr:hypothetical protein DPMN_139739 [Dreissena polymorpha]